MAFSCFRSVETVSLSEKKEVLIKTLSHDLEEVYGFILSDSLYKGHPGKFLIAESEGIVCKMRNNLRKALAQNFCFIKECISLAYQPLVEFNKRSIFKLSTVGLNSGFSF